MRSKALVKLHNIGGYELLDRNTTDDRLIEMWLNAKRSQNTKDAYARDIIQFRAVVMKPLQAILPADLERFGNSLAFEKLSSQARRMHAVKSLFSYALKLGYIRLNPAAAWEVPKPASGLAARILTEEQVMMMLAREDDDRNHAVIRLLYNAGLRVSELCSLTWRDIQPNAVTGWQVTVIGKGGKERSVPISKDTYAEILAQREDDASNSAVFVRYFSKEPIDRVEVYRIVSEAAARVGIATYTNEKGKVCSRVSPHWLRHAHASHALDRGAPIQLVKETLGHANIITTNNYAHARPNASSSTYLSI